jgi:phosphoribosylaminoimidazole carboxylase (NCAIR synthetase)
MKPILPGSTIGVLGSGQLGRMFTIAARRMGYRVHTFSPETDTPTGQVADLEMTASYDDLDAVRKFASNVSVVTFEFENVPYDSRTKQQYEQKVMDLKRNKNIDWAATDKLKELDYEMRRELYMRTAGEADARAAQARQHLTAEELRQFPINQNFYDIPLKEMLIGKP